MHWQSLGISYDPTHPIGWHSLAKQLFAAECPVTDGSNSICTSPPIPISNEKKLYHEGFESYNYSPILTLNEKIFFSVLNIYPPTPQR